MPYSMKTVCEIVDRLIYIFNLLSTQDRRSLYNLECCDYSFRILCVMKKYYQKYII